MQKLAIKYFSDSYRGIVATEKIHKGETVFFYPKEEMLTRKIVDEGTIGKAIKKHGLDLSGPVHSAYAGYIFEEREKPDSKWAFLFNSFPKSADNFPVLFSKDELKLLQGSSVVRKILTKE
jgi:hypothetical protein